MSDTERRFYVTDLGYVADRSRPDEAPMIGDCEHRTVFLGDEEKTERMARVLNDLEDLKRDGFSPSALITAEDLIAEARQHHIEYEPLVYGPDPS